MDNVNHPNAQKDEHDITEELKPSKPSVKHANDEVVWESDLDLREVALEVLSSTDDLAETLESLGTLILAGFEDDAKKWCEKNPDLDVDLFSQVCERLADNLNCALASIGTEQLQMTTKKDCNLREEIMHHLSVRDSVECILIGAELTGLTFNNDNLKASVDTFKQTLKPLPLDQSRRSARHAWMQAKFRKRFWWWCKNGSDNTRK